MSCESTITIGGGMKRPGGGARVGVPKLSNALAARESVELELDVSMAHTT